MPALQELAGVPMSRAKEKHIDAFEWELIGKESDRFRRTIPRARR
jgi:hypothetical protein